MTTEQAINQVQSAIRDDEGYRQTWQANLAMAAQDEGVDHATANKIADRFLEALLR